MSDEGTFETYKPLPNGKDEIDAYMQKANPILEQRGHQIVRKSQYELMKYALGILLLGICVFGYMAFNDKFKSEISCPSCPDLTCPTLPAIEAPECPACPQQICNVSCNYPSTLKVNLNNGS